MRGANERAALTVAALALAVMAAGARLRPDSYLHAAVLPLGMVTLSVMSAASAGAVVWMMRDLGASWRGIVGLLVLFGWVLVLPGADAEGAALVLAGCYARPWRLCAPLVHIATLGTVAALALGGGKRSVWLGGLAAVLVAVVLDGCRSALGWEAIFDFRYLLPAYALSCVPVERWRPDVRAVVLHGVTRRPNSVAGTE